jgi:hypothetical protein
MATTVLGAVEESGLSIAAFAEREGLEVNRLYRWRERLRECPAPQAFVELVPPPVRASLEVVLKSGDLIRLDGEFDASAFRQVVEVLRSC